MRTTVNVDDDVLLAVQERARREHRSVGALLSELARMGLRGAGRVDEGRTGLHGFLPLEHRGTTVSNALIDELRELTPE
ncbi:MAG: CopG family transcriptional regulator [Acidimicrobiales bacterium]